MDSTDIVREIEIPVNRKCRTELKWEEPLHENSVLKQNNEISENSIKIFNSTLKTLFSDNVELTKDIDRLRILVCHEY
jgi:hypothetical protein